MISFLFKTIKCFKTDDCNVNITKCANCNGNHHAYDQSCLNRELYLNIKSKFMSKKLNNRNIPYSYNNKQFTYNKTQFPLLPNQKRHVQLVIHSPSATQFSPNNWNKSANAANNFPRNGDYSCNASQNLHNNKNNNNSDLLTMSE